jgi:iron complex transport system substrate-binding protein
VYEAIMAERLRRSGYHVARQQVLPIHFDGVSLAEGFRVDLLVEGKLIIEIKSCERLAPVHSKQLLTYLRLARQPVGLLMNFWWRNLPRRSQARRQRSSRHHPAAPHDRVAIFFVASLLSSCLRVKSSLP